MTPEELSEKKALIKAQAKHVGDLVVAIAKGIKEIPEDRRGELELEVMKILNEVEVSAM